MNSEDKQFLEVLILKMKNEINETIDGLASRLDTRINKIDTSLQLHNQEGLIRSEKLNALKCQEHADMINKYRTDSEIKDKEHGTQLKIQWWAIAIILAGLAGIALAIIKKVF